eukprot:TRINITY_DN26060_c1_g2_i1.p4 TRINITY_DN26060_c1_g2~~TRINITY_DN26060_c1_g2_i1.p4  ORF type:complete len:117 (-),score=3.86 TRINITY_DN26060_c1_g2_i1:333-683(-)
MINNVNMMINFVALLWYFFNNNSSTMTNNLEMTTIFVALQRYFFLVVLWLQGSVICYIILQFHNFLEASFLGKLQAYIQKVLTLQIKYIVQNEECNHEISLLQQLQNINIFFVICF